MKYFEEYKRLNDKIVSDIIALLNGKKKYIFHYPKVTSYTPYLHAIVVTNTEDFAEVPIKGFEIDENNRICYILFNPEENEDFDEVDFEETYDYDDCAGDTTSLLIHVLEEMESELKK